MGSAAESRCRRITASAFPARPLPPRRSSTLVARWRRFGIAALWALCSGTAAGAEFDLCVRGSALGFNRVARLTLMVRGADVAAASAASGDEGSPLRSAEQAARLFAQGRYGEGR